MKLSRCSAVGQSTLPGRPVLMMWLHTGFNVEFYMYTSVQDMADYSFWLS